MVFRKIFFLLLIIVLPVTVFAVEKDYLVVSLSYDFNTGRITLLSVEQRVLDSSQVLISDQGEFKILLVDKNEQIVARNTFTMPLGEEVEVVGPGGVHRYVRPNSYSITVVLPLEQSFKIEDLVFQVKKDGQLIFNEKFSTNTFTVLEVKENTIKTPEPLVPGGESAFLNYLIWIIVVLIILFVWRWWMIRKRASESEYMMR